MYETRWRQLIDYLDGVFSSAAERGPDEITVTLEVGPQPARTVSIVMTPLQWDHYVSIPWGDFESAARSVAKVLAGLPPDAPYLVYDKYELHPSTQRALPPAADGTPGRMQNGSGVRGHWVVEDDDGTVVDRFEDHR